MADNLLTRFTERFFPPVTNRPPAEVEKDSRVVIYGLSLIPQTSLKDVIGVPHDTDHALLYALYTLHVDLNACVNKWASGVSSAGWRIMTMDPDEKVGPEAKRLIDESATWLRDPTRTRRSSCCRTRLSPQGRATSTRPGACAGQPNWPPQLARCLPMPAGHGSADAN